MPGHSHCRRSRLFILDAAGIGLCALLCASGIAGQAQDAAHAPASTPAGTMAERPPVSAAPSNPKRAAIGERQARQADDAYLEGAKQIEHNDLAAAERSFARAVELNPEKQEYVLSLALTREHRVTALVQAAAKARLMGDNTRADSLLAEARVIDPDNSIVTQHKELDASVHPKIIETLNASGGRPSSSNTAGLLDGPIEFEPSPGTKSFHQRGSEQNIIRSVYSAFGIAVTFDDSVVSTTPMRFDLDNADFATATRVVKLMTQVFAIPVQPKSALIATDTTENRDRLSPQVEETIYLPGVSSEEMTELANLARNVFELKQVTASPTGGDIMVRGDEGTLRLLNATYADMIDGGSDVLLDIHLYEVDKTRMQNIGAQLPTSAGVFPAATELQSILDQNQSLIQQAIASGLLKLTGKPSVDIPAELGILFAAGQLSGISQITGLLLLFGQYSGFPLAGLFLGSGSSFNMALKASEARTLDDIQVRAGDNQPVNFRSGTRYPITTSTYSSGISSSLAASVAGLNINGTSVSSLLNRYLGTSQQTIPQIQYEDLGITVKAKPRILRSGDVHLELELKIEALGGGSNDGIPILNNRSLTSTITVPAGQTALLASEVSKNESRAISGLPGLSELPGFQGTDQDIEGDKNELLITITPHIVREGNMRVASRRLAMEHSAPEYQ